MPENRPAGFLAPCLRKPLNWPAGFKGLKRLLHGEICMKYKIVTTPSRLRVKWHATQFSKYLGMSTQYYIIMLSEKQNKTNKQTNFLKIPSPKDSLISNCFSVTGRPWPKSITHKDPSLRIIDQKVKVFSTKNIILQVFSTFMKFWRKNLFCIHHLNLFPIFM